MDGEPIYYYGQHEIWNNIGGRQKLTNFILKFYFYLPKENKERKPGHGTTETSFDLLSTCLLIMKFRFILGSENPNAGNMTYSRRPHVHHHCAKT